MNPPPATAERLRFLTRIAGKESRHLTGTARRLFTSPFTPARVAQLEAEPELAERVDAFVSRFGRLQDTLGDKLLPLLLTALGEKAAAMIDNLDRAERLGLIPSVEHWMEMRRLRNQMIHGYVEDAAVLSSALEAANSYVSVLTSVTTKLTTEIERRGWA